MHSSFMKDLIEYSGYKPKEAKDKQSSSKNRTPNRNRNTRESNQRQVQEVEWRETRSGRETVKGCTSHMRHPQSFLEGERLYSRRPFLYEVCT